MQFVVALAALAATLIAGAAPGQALPAPSALRVILPVSAGTGIDGLVRGLQPALSSALGGESVVVENLPGADGIIATRALVNAAPDGRIIGILSNSHALLPSVRRSLPYDPVADVTPIARLAGAPFVLVVNPDAVPAKSAQELRALLSANPDRYTYATLGNGTITHLAAALFFEAAEVRARQIPYSGFGALLGDLVAGRVAMSVMAVPAALPHVASGALRAIGVMSGRRLPMLPEAQTFAEQGFRDVVLSGWAIAAGPPRLPMDRVLQLYRALAGALDDPQVGANLAARGYVAMPMSPEASAVFLQSEHERYARLAKRLGIEPE